MKHMRRLLTISLLLAAAVRAPLAQAEGGLVFQPYWTYRTEAPVVGVQAGDITNDGTPEIVVATADGLVYVLENDGDLAWRYELGFAPLSLLVDKLEGDTRAAEIIVYGADARIFGTRKPPGDTRAAENTVYGEQQVILLSDSPRPAFTFRGILGSLGADIPINIRTIAADVNGDGRSELVHTVRKSVAVFDTTVGHLMGGTYFEQPAVDVWAGDLDADGRLEIVPSLAGGRDVTVLESSADTLNTTWAQQIEGEMGLVQGGDVDGDGQAEVVALSTAWDLFLLESDGSRVWHDQTLVVENPTGAPVPGQLVVHDLNGDGQAEILVMGPPPMAVVHVFDGGGRQVWQHTLKAASSAAKLTAHDIDDDGKVEVVITSIGLAQVYLLNADGQRLAEYHISANSGEAISALDCADLSGDGWGEIIVGTETGIQVFGTSDQVVRRELWQSPKVGFVSALLFSDLDADGRDEVVAGSTEGWVYVLADEGRAMWSVDLSFFGLPCDCACDCGEFTDFAWTLGAGDVDGDGRGEVVAGTDAGQVHLLDEGGESWAVPLEKRPVNSLAVRDLDGDNQPEIIAGAGQASGLVALLDGEGSLRWQRTFDEPVLAVGVDGGRILAGTQSGRVYHLTADGSPAGEQDWGAQVLSLDTGMAAMADGRICQLDEGGLTLIRDLGQALKTAQVRTPWAAIRAGEQEISLVARDGSIWQETVNGAAFNVAPGDLNGDGEAEIAATSDERIRVFGLALDQPPLLTGPDLAETRTGYAYSVEVNDPEGDSVAVTLEIWDPSAGSWMVQPAQYLGEGLGQARLTWEVPQPFDTWDSGRESRFRFSYDDGHVQGTLEEIPGPLAIPTTPWYGYYGQRVGLGALIALVPGLGLLLYRRQRAYRRSPMGQAEALLGELCAGPHGALRKLHNLARDDPPQLALVSGLASEAGQATIADLSEGFHLILTRPEVALEGIEAILEATQSLNGSRGTRPEAIADLYDLFQRLLEVNTVSRIVTLRPRLAEAGEVDPDPTLAQLASALSGLEQVAQSLRNYQRVDLVEDKVAYLAQAIESLGRLEREFKATLPQPEGNILARIAANWLAVSTNALQDLQGQAQIEVSLKTRQLLTLDQAIITLELSNTGRSPASNLAVTLLPGQGYEARDGTAYLEILPAGRSAVVELPVSAVSSMDQFRAEFSITYDDRERRGKSLAFADRVQLLRPAARFRPVPNPYAPGTPLAPGSSLFFGREDLFQFIAENMAGLARQNILVLVGQRRMGKTSFLRQLPARLSGEYLPVYIDGQSLGVDPGMASFFYDLAVTVADTLADQGIDVAEPQPEEFKERPSGTFERSFLPAVFEAIGARQLLLLFDEFEELEVRVASGKLEPSIFSYFRHLMQHVQGLGFIFVGTHRLEALTADYWSIFFNIALYKHVTFLKEAAARALIVEPVAGSGLLYDDLAMDKMLRVTAGHPYFLQLICHALVNHANRERRGYLTIQDVNDTLGEMIELGEAHFAFLWEQSSSRERLVLACLTGLLSRQPTVTMAQVTELLRERGVAIEAQDVVQALGRLVERDILRELRGQPPRYDYKVALVRLWVERYKALGQLIEQMA